MYGFIVVYVTCDGVLIEERFDYLDDAKKYGDDLRPNVRGSLRIIDLFTGFPVGETYCGLTL